MSTGHTEQEASTGGAPVEFEVTGDTSKRQLSISSHESARPGSKESGMRLLERANTDRSSGEESNSQLHNRRSQRGSSAEESNSQLQNRRRQAEVRFDLELDEAQNENDCLNQIRNEIDDLVNRPSSSPYAQLFQRCIIALILISTCSVIVETVPEMRGQLIFLCIEVVVTLLFTVELLLRFAACKKMAEFFTNGFNLVDLFAILPGYIEMVRAGVAYKNSSYAILSLRMIRLLWLVRIMRLAKVARHSRLLNVCFAVLAKENTLVFSILTLIMGLTTMSATLLYFVESDRCQTLGVDCEGFDSIPSACWFSITTLATVGYGDRVPRTVAGKIIASLLSVGGVMIIALAGAMMSWDFAEHFKEERAKKRIDVGRRRSFEREGIEQVLEVQAATQQFMEACDQLMARLILMCSERAREAEEDEQQLLCCDVALLKLLQERARLLRAEVQNYSTTCVTEIRSRTKNAVGGTPPRSEAGTLPRLEEDHSQYIALPTLAGTSREDSDMGDDRVRSGRSRTPSSPKQYVPPTVQPSASSVKSASSAGDVSGLEAIAAS